jgi:hypothetical protein
MVSGSAVETGLLIQTSLGRAGGFRSASYEALWVTLVSNIEHILALPQEVFRLTIVNHRWCQQAYPGVTVLLVVPPKKNLTKSTTVLDAPKAVRELRPILEGAELTLGIRIVVRNVRPTMRFRRLDRRVEKLRTWTSSTCHDPHGA